MEREECEKCVRKRDEETRKSMKGKHFSKTAEREKQARAIVRKTRADAVRTYKRHSVMQQDKRSGHTHMESLTPSPTHTSFRASTKTLCSVLTRVAGVAHFCSMLYLSPSHSCPPLTSLFCRFSFYSVSPSQTEKAQADSA